MRFLLLKLPQQLMKLLFYGGVFATPVLGVWLASSLVAYVNGPTTLAALSGLLLFPLVPVVWDALGQKRRRPGILTWGDRIALRTLALNLIFLTLLLALRPQASFLALSTRGDWFLDGRQGAPVEFIRQGTFKLASGLEWLYLRFHSNPYEQYADSGDRPPQPQPSEVIQPIDDDSPQPSVEQPRPSTQTPPAESEGQASSPLPTRPQASGWPWKNAELHPAVAQMPSHVETSIASVAQYIAQQESDPFLRIKALHDYVADRIAYDADSYFSGRYPPQDAETVFQTRKAVCAGYAKLLEALGRAIGEEIVYVVGDSRSSTSDLSGQGHAWNAARIKGHWYLIDATWDSGSVDRSGFSKRYQTDYLFPPANVMIISHFPDDSAWQLLPSPISRGEFLRQPMLRPRFFAEGLQLVSPTRSQTDVAGDAVVELQNPNQRWILASYAVQGSNQSEHCGSPSQGKQIVCSLPRRGTYEVRLFSSDEPHGQPFAYLGQMEFNR